MHFSTENIISGSQRAILPAPCIHFLATAGILATERARGNRGLSSGPYFEAKKSIQPGYWEVLVRSHSKLTT